LNHLKDIQNYNLKQPNTHKSQVMNQKRETDESRWLFESGYKNKLNNDFKIRNNTEEKQT